jgi:hypothetical protein
MAKPGEGAIWECPVMAPLCLPADQTAATNLTAAAADPHPGSPSVPAAPPPTPQQGAPAAQAQQMGAAVRTSEQQQQQLEVERAMSGCLGLCGDWLAGSTDGSTAAAETPASPSFQQQQQQQERLPPTHVFSVSCGVCPAIYWCVCMLVAESSDVCPHFQLRIALQVAQLVFRSAIGLP